jgi:hypothetical protein
MKFPNGENNSLLNENLFEESLKQTDQYRFKFENHLFQSQLNKTDGFCFSNKYSSNNLNI